MTSKIELSSELELMADAVHIAANAIEAENNAWIERETAAGNGANVDRHQPVINAREHVAYLRKAEAHLREDWKETALEVLKVLAKCNPSATAKLPDDNPLKKFLAP